MSFPSTGMSAWGGCLKLPLDAALEASKGAQELQSEPPAQGVSLAQDPHGSGDCWVGFVGKPGTLSSSIPGVRGHQGLSPTPIPALRAQQTSTSPPGQPQFQPSPCGCFPHQVFSKFQLSNATILERLSGPSVRGRALLALSGVTGHYCPPWRDPLETFPQPSPSQCELKLLGELN